MFFRQVVIVLYICNYYFAKTIGRCRLDGWLAQSVTLPNLSIVIEVRFPCPTASSVIQFMASSWTFYLKCFRNMNHQSLRFFAFYGTDYLNADYLNGCVAL